jgi:two-component system response regulator DctR
MDDIRVFIVEDDPMVAHINRRFTEQVPGFRVIGTAGNGEESFQAIRRMKPDLVLLDVYMPIMNGRELIQRLRTAAVDCDVIFITAAQDTDTICNALRSGAVDYIIKPFSFERLAQALNSFQERRRQLKGKQQLDQVALDRLTNGGERPQPMVLPDEELPKGLDRLTLDRVLALMEGQAAPISAQEAAMALGIARITAHRYLDYLARTGAVTVEQCYGSVGRPRRMYRLV